MRFLSFVTYSQFEERYKLANYAHRISLFAEGMLGLYKCLRGVIEVDPKVLLVTGIKNAMVKVVSSKLHNGFIFKKELTPESFESIIKAISDKMDNTRSALEYVQDLIGIDALSIWLEQMTRIIEAFASRESGIKSIRSKISEDDKEKNLNEVTDYYTIENFRTFYGRLIAGMLIISSQAKTIMYLPHLNSRYSSTGTMIFCH